jgi:predicted DCC family thiol-disulfide oxidoreductase YuxK
MGSPGAIADRVPILILFDGVCNLCNGTVKFIIKRDPDAIFRFASLQSEFGRSKLLHFNMDPERLHSVVVIDRDEVLEKSDAALHIVRHLAYPWKFLVVLKWLPKKIRDACYNLIAGNRYKLFGQRDACMIPTIELRSRFLD